MNSEFEARQVEAWLAHTVAAVDAYPVPDEARGEAPVPVAGGLDFAVDVGLQLRGAGVLVFVVTDNVFVGVQASEDSEVPMESFIGLAGVDDAYALEELEVHVVAEVALPVDIGEVGDGKDVVPAVGCGGVVAEYLVGDLKA